MIFLIGGVSQVVITPSFTVFDDPPPPPDPLLPHAASSGAAAATAAVPAPTFRNVRRDSAAVLLRSVLFILYPSGKPWPGGCPAGRNDKETCELRCVTEVLCKEPPWR